jgi:hypothetical protein
MNAEKTSIGAERKPSKALRLGIAAAVAALAAGGAAVAIIVAAGGTPGKPGEPFRALKGVPDEAVKAQRLGQVDFGNPHAARNAPRIVASAGRLDKLLIVSKLKEAGTPEAAKALEEIANAKPGSGAPEDDVRPHAIGALVHFKEGEAWTALGRLASSTDEVLRRRTAVSLGYGEPARARPLLETLRNDSSEAVREAADEALQRLDRPGQGGEQ